MHANVVDFKKAFEMVDRRVSWRIVRHYGIPQKMVNIIKSFYEDTSCRFVHNADLSVPFTVYTGVRQSCILSPLVIDGVMKTTMEEPRGIQWTLLQKLEELDFADNVGLLSHTREHIQAKTERLRDVARTTGLESNVTKTNNRLRINASQEAPITIDGHAIEEVDRLTYLGSIVSKTGGTDEDIRANINKTRKAFATLKAVWRSKNLSYGTNLTLVNCNVKPVLLCEAETRRRTKNFDHKLQVFLNTCLRPMLRISNQELLRKTGQDPIIVTIRTESGNRSGIPYVESRRASSAKLWIGTLGGNGKG